MANGFFIAIGGVLLGAAFMVFATLPPYFNPTHKLLLSGMMLILGGVIMVAGIKD